MAAVGLDGEIGKRRFRVAIFGSARIKEDDALFKQVYDLSKLITRENIDIVTGGGPGLMRAATRGHDEALANHRSRSIGLTIELPFKEGHYGHLDLKGEFSRFSERLDNFMLLSNAVVVAPGGVGTLLEFLYTWQLVQVQQICNIPIILLGNMWPDFIKWVEKWPLAGDYLSKEDLSLLYYAKDAMEAMKIIKMAHVSFKKGGKNFCFNYQKYRLA